MEWGLDSIPIFLLPGLTHHCLSLFLPVETEYYKSVPEVTCSWSTGFSACLPSEAKIPRASDTAPTGVPQLPCSTPHYLHTHHDSLLLFLLCPCSQMPHPFSSGALTSQQSWQQAFSIVGRLVGCRETPQHRTSLTPRNGAVWMNDPRRLKMILAFPS